MRNEGEEKGRGEVKEVKREGTEREKNRTEEENVFFFF